MHNNLPKKILVIATYEMTVDGLVETGDWEAEEIKSAMRGNVHLESELIDTAMCCDADVIEVEYGE